jgi:hypothetical protein
MCRMEWRRYLPTWSARKEVVMQLLANISLIHTHPQYDLTWCWEQKQNNMYRTACHFLYELNVAYGMKAVIYT